MMRLTPPLAPRRLRPGPTAGWIGLAIGAALLALAAALLVGRAASPAQRLTVQASAPDPARAEAIAASALARLRANPGVTGALRVDDAEVARLLDGVATGGIGAPILLDATLARGADAAALTATLDRMPGVTATVTDPARDPASGFARALRRLALLATLAALGGVAAIRRPDPARGRTVALLAELGASDRQIAHQVAWEAAPDALAGAGGALFGAALLILLATARGAPAALLGLGGWSLLALAAGIGAAISIAAAFVHTALSLRRGP